MNNLQPAAAALGADNACPRVTLVTTTDCHLCEDAHAVLLDLAARGQVSLHVVGADSEKGRALLAEHRPGLFPLTLLDGAFLSAGRLPRRKLDRALAGRASLAGAGA